jgi:hypothetical protein
LLLLARRGRDVLTGDPEHVIFAATRDRFGDDVPAEYAGVELGGRRDIRGS